MDSQPPLKLPVIDFTKSDLKPGTDEWNSVKRQVQQALQVYGCFEALFKKIPSEIREAIFVAAEDLFDRSSEIKGRHVSEKPFYYGDKDQHANVPSHEVIDFEKADVTEKVEEHTRTFWPQGNPSFSKTINSFAKQLSELDQTVRRMILESFNLEKYTDEHMDSTDYAVRVLKYERPKSSERQVGILAHTDKNILTILYQNEVNGLGIQSSTGEWIDAKPSKDSFIVLVGESLHAWLNGRLKAPDHRVIMSGDKPRYTVGLFTSPKAGYITKAPEELVDESHPLLYKPFEFTQLLKFYHESSYSNSAFKDYCGV